MADEKPKEAPSAGAAATVSDEELQASFSGPAVHSNKMYVSPMGAGARISFMEQVGDVVPPEFRVAVLLSYPDAIALRDLLTRQLEKIEVAMKLAEKVSTEKGTISTEQDGG